MTTPKKPKKDLEPITLGTIFVTAEAWAELTKLKKAPQMSYELAAYYRDHISPELITIEEERKAKLAELGSAPDAEGLIRLEGKNFVKYRADFEIAYLGTATKIKPMGLTMDQVIKSLSKNKDNFISGHHLLQLEPFFTKP